MFFLGLLTLKNMEHRAVIGYAACYRRDASDREVLGFGGLPPLSKEWRTPKGQRLESHTNARLGRLLPKGRKNFDGEGFPSESI